MSRSGLAATAIGASLLVSPSTSGGQVPVFPAEVELATVDVIVRDEKGGALRSLASDDFVLTEDGKPQTIVSFEAVDRSGALEEMDERPSPVATNEGAAEDRSGAFVLLVDDLGLDATRLPRLVKALHGVLETALSDGDEVTLSTASGSLWWTLRFPEGREDLSVLLGKVKGRKVPETSVEPMSDYEAHQIANLERAPVVPDQASFPPPIWTVSSAGGWGRRSARAPGQTSVRTWCRPMPRSRTRSARLGPGPSWPPWNGPSSASPASAVARSCSCSLRVSSRTCVNTRSGRWPASAVRPTWS